MDKVLRITANEFDHHRGTIDSPVTIVQYGDYECPYSASLAPDMDQLFEQYQGILCHVYRHFPQPGIHEYAEIAALASEAAGLQQQFWEFHRVLFENSENLSPDMIRMLARRTHLDMTQFETDMKRYELYDRIKEDAIGGTETGISSTPTLFINGVLYEGSSSYMPLKEAVELTLGSFRSAWY